MKDIKEILNKLSDSELIQIVNGRVHFVDMQITKDSSKDYDTRNRLVDPRTINYFICRGVKYEVK